MHRQIHRIRSLFTTLAFMASISCMQAEKVSLDTSGAQGLLLGSLSFELGLFGGGSGGYSGAQFVAVGGDTGWYSFDGTSDWTAFAFTGSGINVRSVAFGNGTWVAVGNYNDTGCGIWTSPDGVTWTRRDCAPGDNELKKAVVYGKGVFLAGGGLDGGIVKIIRSTDNGATWFIQSAGSPMDQDITTMAFDSGTGNFVASTGANQGLDEVYLSTDGINWTAVEMPPYSQSFKLKPGSAGIVIAYGSFNDGTNTYWSYSQGIISSGTISWNNGLEKSYDYQSSYSFTYGEGRHVAVGHDYYQSTCYFLYSTGSSSWGSGSQPPGCSSASGAYWTAVTYSPGRSRFIAAGFNNSASLPDFVWSDDGLTWNWKSGNNVSPGNAPNSIAAAR